MRKVILGAGITLDGCIARPEGSIDYLVMTKEGAKEFARFYKTIDTIVIGRKTLDAVADMAGAPRPATERARRRHLYQSISLSLAPKNSGSPWQAHLPHGRWRTGA